MAPAHRDVEGSAILEPLGLSRVEEACYRLLLGRRALTASELAEAAQVGTAQARRALGRLEDKGLVSRTPGSKPRFLPAPPALAVEALVLRREQELKRARIEAAWLAKEFEDQAHHRSEMPPVDLVSGQRATRQRQVQLQRSARQEVCILDRPPYAYFSGGPNEEELALLSNGVGYRVLYDDTSFDVAGKLEAARVCIAAGEQGRVLAGVPLKLMVADHQLALTHDPDRVQDSLVVYQSPLLDALVTLFDLLWDRATPLSFGGAFLASGGEPQLDDIDREVLVLLGVGAKDEAIARRLGLGVRTVRRRVARLMRLLDAQTRFQAGVNAARSGWT